MKTKQDNIFIKEVISGKLITINRINFLDILKLGPIKCKEEEKTLHLISSKVTIDNKKLTPTEVGEIEDFEIINFINESISQMTKTNYF